MSVEKPDIQAIFNEASALKSDEERAQFLDQACGFDRAARERVEALLRAHSEAGGFFGGKSPADIATEYSPQPEAAGMQIGPYKLLQLVGEGGMGSVWMAEQHEPVRRKVALKVIKPGMDSRQVIARFEAERQALSLMDHPNIAKVLDAGTTASGRPFFVMELVKGQPITEYCDEKQLTPRQRLELLLPVCQAVQHAHQKGIIHRDIKPSNILVAEYDQTAVPKVIDFGVAKAICQPLTEKTMFTGLGQIVGTLEYMSPEQAKVNQLDIDTRSDIYSLGVLLYELLTGSTPFDKLRLRSAAWDEMLRIIREEEPPRPSTKLSSSDTLPSIAANRRTEPARLSTLVRGELDWIVMKALEKDRSRRYETANGLAMDIQRYLSDEAVLACPPSRAYRFRKFARKNKAQLAVAGIVTCAILVAAGGIGWAVRDRMARQSRLTSQVELILADMDRLIAEQNWNAALTVAQRAEAALTTGEASEAIKSRLGQSLLELGFLDRLEKVMLEAATVSEEGGHTASVADKAFAAAFREFGVDVENLSIDVAADRLHQHPNILVAIAESLDAWAAIHRGSDSFYDTPLATLACRLDPDPIRDQLRQLRAKKGQPTTPEVQMQLREVTRSLIAGNHSVREFLLHSASLKIAGLEQERELLLRAALQQHPQDLRLNLRLADLKGDQKEWQESVRYYTAAIAIRPGASPLYNNLGFTLEKLKRLDEAIECCRKAIELDPGNVIAHNNLGAGLIRLGRFDEAVASFRRAIELSPEYASAYSNLGAGLRKQNKLDESIAACRKAIELDPNFALAYTNLGCALSDQNNPEEAIAAHRKAIELDPNLSLAHSDLGNALRKLQRLDEAIISCRKAIELDPLDAVNHSNLGVNLGDKGMLAEGVASLRKAIELDPGFAGAYSNLGAQLLEQNMLDEAIAACRKAIELDPELASAYCNLGEGLRRQKRLDEAIAACRKAIELDPNYAMAHNNLGTALSDQNRSDEVIAAYRKAIELDPNLALAHGNLGNTLRVQNKLEEAIVCFRKAIELDPNNFCDYINLGVALRGQNRLEEAIEAQRKAIELEPTSALAYANLGGNLFSMGKLDEAIAACRKAIELDPMESLAYTNLGVSLSDQGKLDEAVSTLRKAIELDPEYAVAYNGLGVALRRQGKLDEAITVLRKAIELNPQDALAYANLGSNLCALGKPDDGIAALRKATELAPENVRLQNDLGTTLFNFDRPDEAVICFSKVTEIDPMNISAQIGLAASFINLKRFDEAIAASRKAIELDPEKSAAHTNLGTALKALKRHDEAVASFRTAIEHDPKNKSVWGKLASTFLAQGNEVEEISCYRKMLELDPNDAGALNNLAWRLLTTQDPTLRAPEESLILSRKAVAINPSWANLDTLSEAAFGCGQWQESLDARLKCLEQRPAGPRHMYFLAMTHWHLGSHEEARKWHAQANAEIEKKPDGYPKAMALKREADALLASPPPSSNGGSITGQ